MPTPHHVVKWFLKKNEGDALTKWVGGMSGGKRSLLTSVKESEFDKIVGGIASLTHGGRRTSPPPLCEVKIALASLTLYIAGTSKLMHYIKNPSQPIDIQQKDVTIAQ